MATPVSASQQLLEHLHDSLHRGQRRCLQLKQKGSVKGPFSVGTILGWHTRMLRTMSKTTKPAMAIIRHKMTSRARILSCLEVSNSKRSTLQYTVDVGLTST